VNTTSIIESASDPHFNAKPTVEGSTRSYMTPFTTARTIYNVIAYGPKNIKNALPVRTDRTT
jgi:hypothetical protein